MLIYDFQDISDDELESSEYKQELFEQFQVANKNIHSARPVTMKDIEELINEEIENRRV